MLFPTLLTSMLLTLPGFGPEKIDVLVNEYSQPNQYELDIRLDMSRSRELTDCIGQLTGLAIALPVTDNVVAETEGINLTYLPDHNHLALKTTDYTTTSADRARAAGEKIKGCLELFARQPDH